MPIGTNIWQVKIFRNKLEKIVFLTKRNLIRFLTPSCSGDPFEKNITEIIQEIIYNLTSDNYVFYENYSSNVSNRRNLKSYKIFCFKNCFDLSLLE